MMRRVGELSDATAAEVAESRQAYRGAAEALDPFKRLLNVWLSEHFGNKGAQHTTSTYAGAIVEGDYTKANPQDKQAIEAALALASDKRFFHWELEFPEVFYDKTERKESGGFDAVVGNPPYGSTLALSEKQFVSGSYLSVKTAVDTFALFMENATNRSRSEGEIGIIVPSGWLTSPQHEPLRNYVLKAISLRTIIHLPYDVFPDAYIDTVIFIGRKAQSYRHNAPYIEAKVRTKRFAPYSNSENEFSRGLDYREVDTAYWIKDTDLRMVTELSDTKGDILDKIKSRSISAGHLLDVDRGITPILPVSDNFSGQSALVFLGDFERYWFSDVTKRIRYDKSLAEYTPPKYFQNAGIIIRRIISRQQRIIAALNTYGLVFNKSYLIALLTNDSKYNILYLLSVIASRLQSRLFIWSSEVGKRDDFPQLDIKTIRSLHIRAINFTTSVERRAGLVAQASDLYMREIAEEEPVGLLNFVSARLAAQPDEADVIHDLLAYLAEEMIRLNREKQAAQTAFLDGLVAMLRVQPDKEGRTGLDALTGKSRLADYPGDYQKDAAPLTEDEFFAILQKNKARLGVRLSDPALTTRLRAAYQTSLAQVVPLNDRLARTDWLIDQIVYRLYGLTEAEIAVVEGN
jgi:hypothetical protein